jgi:hypothetical protein
MPDAKDALGGVDYQRAGQVRQLLAERVNARAYGMTERLAAIDKQLAELGYTRKGGSGKDADAVAKAEAPPGRSTRGRQTADAGSTDPDDKPASPGAGTGKGKG